LKDRFIKCYKHVGGRGKKVDVDINVFEHIVTWLFRDLVAKSMTVEEIEKSLSNKIKCSYLLDIYPETKEVKHGENLDIVREKAVDVVKCHYKQRDIEIYIEMKRIWIRRNSNYMLIKFSKPKITSVNIIKEEINEKS